GPLIVDERAKQEVPAAGEDHSIDAAPEFIDAKAVIGSRREPKLWTNSPDDLSGCRASGRKIELRLDVSQSRDGIAAGSHRRQVKDRHNRASDQIPTGTELDGNHRLDQQRVDRAFVGSNVVVGVVLKRNADGAGDRILRSVLCGLLV